MRYIRYLFMAVVGLSLILVALANRGMVTIRVLPEEMAAYLGQPLSYELPLFVVIFGGIIVGLLIGFVWEWLREHKHRADARLQKREKERLEREVKGLKRKSNEGKDEVLALLDDSAAAR
ncbi:lipopolysaccharide assembly protein LapA domain-containing protein [Litoreibacter janthinus]|uniref:Lipopolysaccharide assembly protein A domain-containing protein n=1 Tax=Litoreibacter janthinus TaxID=670154 RepID=A0A1I6G9J7_9RHOB|nr:LapA family protein [Litoreibacter janthinus]SFR38849.1 Protein of unknown function [Litoreibacter janthinus]